MLIKDCFKNELWIIRQLESEYLVNYTEVFEDNTNLIIVMEMVYGGELFDRVLL